MKTSVFRNIIFDYGGVIINIDFQRTIDSFIRLGAANFDQLYSKATQSGVFDELDKGNITQEAFVDKVLAWLPKHVTPAEVVQAWNDIMIDLPKYRIKMLEEIKPNYNTFLLSNTNEIHYKVYNEWLKNDYGHDDFAGLFNKAYLSFRLGMRKPDREIFDLVFSQNGLDKKETLFIDDSIHIVHATRSYGILSYWLKDGQDICDIFENGKLKEELEIS
jgi:glucose-1-phosphatase